MPKFRLKYYEDWFKCPKFAYLGFLLEFDLLDFDIFCVVMA